MTKPDAATMDALKREAAAMAVREVRDGMVVGLGTGSTAKHFVELLAHRMREETLSIVGVPTSSITEHQARGCGIPLAPSDAFGAIDLTVDGADEIDTALNLIKGGGGALLREKIVAAASARMIVIADDSKCVPVLGRFALPVEVMPFGLAATRRHLSQVFGIEENSSRMTMRKAADGHVFVTDGGHYIVDVAAERIADPGLISARLAAIPGVVEHGLFVGLAQCAFIAGGAGVRRMDRP